MQKNEYQGRKDQFSTLIFLRSHIMSFQLRGRHLAQQVSCHLECLHLTLEYLAQVLAALLLT